MAAYSKTTWTNSSAPAINADNLNKIENGIEACSKATVYSTTETVIGTWINGETLYRITPLGKRLYSVPYTVSEAGNVIPNIKIYKDTR